MLRQQEVIERVFVKFTKTLFLACYNVYMLKEQLHNMLPGRWVGDSSPTVTVSGFDALKILTGMFQPKGKEDSEDEASDEDYYNRV